MSVQRWIAGSVIASLFILATDAEATVTLARKKNFTGRVSVTGKAANSNFEVWQSSTVGGNMYVDTGFRINTDASGNGTVSIPNVSSGTLLTGHNVKIGNNQGPNNQPPKAVTFAGGTVYWPGNWFASLTPGTSGPHTVLLAQAVTTDGTTLLETWDPGTRIALRLLPSEAKWVNMGAAIVPHGDLQATILSVTDQAVTVQIMSDPTHTTPDDLEIQGLGINVLTTGTVGVEFDWSGSSSDYLSGVFLESFTWPTTQTYEFDRQPVHNATVPVMGPVGLIALAMLVAGVAMWRLRA